MSATEVAGSAHRSRWRLRMAVLLLAYSACILYSTLLPFQFTWGDGDASYFGLALGRDSNHRWPTPMGDLVGNIVLFLPLGALGYCMQSPSRPRARSLAVCLAAGVGLMLSLTVETLQRFTPARDPSTSDVIANTCGSLLGAATAAHWQERLRSSRLGRLAAWEGGDPWVAALVGMMVVVTLYSFMPFDVSLSRVLLRRSVRLACLDPRNDPASWGHLAEGAVLHALLAGVVARLAQRRVGAASSMLWGLGFTFAFALFLESLQVFVKSQVAATLDVCAVLAGSVVGVGLGIGLGGRIVRRYAWHAVVSLYGLSLVFLRSHWLGIGGGADLIEERLAALVPIYGWYFQSHLAGSAEFVNLLLLVAPLGFLVAQGVPARLRPQWHYGVVASACVGWFGLVESFRMMVSGSEPRFSSVIPALLGGLVGTTAWRWGERGDPSGFPAGELGRSGARGPADCIGRTGSSASLGSPALRDPRPELSPCSAGDEEASTRREHPGAP
jgi:VanZ family protein